MQSCFGFRAFPLPADLAADYKDAEITDAKGKLGKIMLLEWLRKA